MDVDDAVDIQSDSSAVVRVILTSSTSTKEESSGVMQECSLSLTSAWDPDRSRARRLKPRDLSLSVLVSDPEQGR